MLHLTLSQLTFLVEANTVLLLQYNDFYPAKGKQFLSVLPFNIFSYPLLFCYK